MVKTNQATVDMKVLLRELRKFTEMKELTPTIVNKLIQRIEIHEKSKKRSRENVKVDIYFAAVRLVDIPTEQQMIDIMEKLKRQNETIEKSA